MGLKGYRKPYCKHSNPTCDDCVKRRDARREWIKEHPDVVKKLSKKYNDKHKEKLKDTSREYYEQNKFRLREYNKNYYHSNKEQYRGYRRQRTTRRRQEKIKTIQTALNLATIIEPPKPICTNCNTPIEDIPRIRKAKFD